MFEKFKKILEPFLTGPSPSFLLAVSGGPDSVALFDLFLRLRRSRFGRAHAMRLALGHVNHGIRGKAADADEQFVKKLAEHAGLSFFSKRVSLHSVSNQEARGREIRRNFFLTLQKKYQFQWIVTAHHRDDALETMLLNFFRGASLEGLSGLHLQEGVFVKPLLPFSKEEILDYLARQGLSYRTDATNKDIRYKRNFIRHKLLPALRVINPNIEKVLLREAEIFSQTSKDLENLARKFLRKKSLRIHSFRKLPRTLRWQVLRLLYRKTYGTVEGLNFVQLEEWRELLEKGETGKEKKFGPKFQLRISYGTFSLQPKL